MKICNDCGKEKELEEFHRSENTKDNRRTQCKSCISKEKRRQYVEDNNIVERFCIDCGDGIGTHRSKYRCDKCAKAVRRERNRLFYQEYKTTPECKEKEAERYKIRKEKKKLYIDQDYKPKKTIKPKIVELTKAEKRTILIEKYNKEFKEIQKPKETK